MDTYFESNLKGVIKELDRRAAKALLSAGKFVLTEVSLRTPVGQYSTGRVGGRLRVSYGDKYDFKAMEAYIGTNVEYAPFVEYGTGIYAESGNGRKTPWAWEDEAGNWHWTRGMKARPHLRPAFQENLTRIQQLIEREFLDGSDE